MDPHADPTAAHSAEAHADAEQNAAAEASPVQEATAAERPAGSEPTADAHEPPKSGFQVFVGQIPYAYTETELRPLFEPFGNVVDIKILKDKATQRPSGCCFVTYDSKTACDAVALAYNNTKTLPGMSKPLSVKLAMKIDENEPIKLYVSRISPGTTEADIHGVFDKFGKVLELYVPKTAGINRGICFIKYATLAEAQGAINGLNNNHTFPGGSGPIEVRIADAKPKRQQQTQQLQMQLQQQLNPFGMGAMGAMGAMGMQGMNNNMMMMQNPYGVNGGVRSGTAGPPGANLFVMNIPYELDEAALYSLFVSFGPIVSVKIFTDNTTGRSKGFGFVSYGMPQSATMAIANMNNYEVFGRRLRVQMKTEGGFSRPY